MNLELLANVRFGAQCRRRPDIAAYLKCAKPEVTDLSDTNKKPPEGGF